MQKALIIKKNEILYLIGYFLMGLSAVVIANSYLFGASRFQICEVVQYISAVFFLSSFCIVKHKILDFAKLLLTGATIFISAVFMHNIAFALYGLSIVTATHIDTYKIVKSSVINNALFLTMVIVPAMLGFIPDDIYYHGNMKAHCLGFAYYSNIPYIVLMETIVGYYLTRSKRQEILFLILSFPVHILVYKICTVRLVLYVYILFLILILMLNFIKRKHYKFLGRVATFLYPVTGALVIVASFKYKDSAILSVINLMINYRLQFNLQGFERYGVTLFGQKIENTQGYIDENFVNHYFFIDCGYVYMLIGYGLILFIIIMLIYTLLSRYAVKTYDIKLMSWCFTICVFSIINNIMFNTALNPLLIIGIKLLMSNYSGYKKRLTSSIKERADG